MAAVWQGRGIEDLVMATVGQGRGLDAAVPMVGQGGAVEEQAMVVERAGASVMDMTTIDSSWVPDGLAFCMLWIFHIFFFFLSTTLVLMVYG